MDAGTKVTGSIRNAGRDVPFTGIVQDSYRSGRDTLVVVVCEDGVTRTASADKVVEVDDARVMSVRGGKVHLDAGDDEVSRPLCGSGHRNTYTHFTATKAPVDCKECSGILARRKARRACEARAGEVAGYRVWPDGVSAKK